MTPKRLLGYLNFIQRAAVPRKLELIQIISTATQGDAKAVKELIAALEKET